MIYYQHFIGDYRRDTSHLTLLEHGAYRQLIDQYYLNESPLPSDLAKLFRLLSARSKDEQDAIKNVLGDFFIETEDGFIHKRCDIEIETYQTKSQTASESAKKRWLKDANAMRTHSEGNANHYSVINNHNSDNNIYGQIDDGFIEFWNQYPKKVGKQHALKAWKKAKPNIDQVLSCLEWQIKSKQWQRNDGQYIPNPSTYINQGRYLDEPDKEVLF